MNKGSPPTAIYGQSMTSCFKLLLPGFPHQDGLYTELWVWVNPFSFKLHFENIFIIRTGNRTKKLLRHLWWSGGILLCHCCWGNEVCINWMTTPPTSYHLKECEIWDHETNWNVEEVCQEFRMVKDILQRVQNKKIDQWNFIRLSNFCITIKALGYWELRQCREGGNLPTKLLIRSWCPE